MDEVIIFCVNDGAVMKAWSDDQEVDKARGFVTMMGDPTAELTRQLDMVLDHPGPMGKGLINRSKRFAIYAENGVVKALKPKLKLNGPPRSLNTTPKLRLTSLSLAPTSWTPRRRLLIDA